MHPPRDARKVSPDVPTADVSTSLDVCDDSPLEQNLHKDEDSNSPPKSTARTTGKGSWQLEMKHLALVCLVVQTVASIAIIRKSSQVGREPGKPSYLKSSFVLLTEIIKLLLSIPLLAAETGTRHVLRKIFSEVYNNPFTTLNTAIPAVLYYIQNKLILVSLHHLSGAVYQVTYQLKILTTAIFSVIILKRTLGVSRWLALVTLTVGVVLISDPTSAPPADPARSRNQLLGFAAVFTACLTSGLAGVYIEKILKDSAVSIWMRNIQLAFFSILFASVDLSLDSAFLRDWGFFHGYNWATWAAIFLQGLGGLIIAAVLKFADNIVKCMGNAIAVVLSCTLSWLVSEFEFNVFTTGGALLVIWATVQYSEILKPFRMPYRSLKLTAANSKNSDTE